MYHTQQPGSISSVVETRRHLNFLQRELVRSQCTPGSQRPARQRQMREQIRALRGKLAVRALRSIH